MAEPRKRERWDESTARLPPVKMPRSLKEWLDGYVQRKSTTISQLVRDYLVALKEEEDHARKGPGY